MFNPWIIMILQRANQALDSKTHPLLTQGCHSQGKSQETNIFSRSWKSHGILLQVSENELFLENQSWKISLGQGFF